MLTMDRPIKTLLVFVALVALGAASRFADVAPNVTAIAGVALFASWIFRSRWLAVGVPMLAMAIADLSLGAYSGWVMASVYACLALPALCGGLVGGRVPSLLKVGGVSFSCAAVFFILTNFAVWASGSNNYAKTIEGLAACYINALPFFRLTVLGDLASSLVLFGGTIMAMDMLKARREALATA